MVKIYKDSSQQRTVCDIYINIYLAETNNDLRRGGVFVQTLLDNRFNGCSQVVVRSGGVDQFQHRQLTEPFRQRRPLLVEPRQPQRISTTTCDHMLKSETNLCRSSFLGSQR